ncbi:MAG TPA: MBL fold metallo-hydrolase [Anaerohalosphaeraceae bacterium]|nr:MBL fold metallo-hydrolase [Anaerohalosphaeraceae bacterium]
MKIDILVLGDFQTNCYCVRSDGQTRHCLVIDPGLDAAPLVQFLDEEGLEPEVIVLTHGHVDHLAGVEMLRERWPSVKVGIHRKDAAMLTDPARNLSMLAGTMTSARPAEIVFDRDETVKLAGMEFCLLHTPGHTPGGICLYSEKEGLVFVGDTLFAGSVGRTDFEGGSFGQLMESIRTKLLTLPETTKVYPGHGPATTIRNEKRFNPFLNGTEEDF